jgi:hypothetical protein
MAARVISWEKWNSETEKEGNYGYQGIPEMRGEERVI